MNIVSIIFTISGTYLLINLIITVILDIKNYKKEYVLLKAKIVNLTTYRKRVYDSDDNVSNTDITVYKTELEYVYESKLFKATKEFYDLKSAEEFVQIYIEKENPDKIISEDKYRLVKSVSHIIIGIILNLIFIIAFFVFAYFMNGLVFE